MRIIFVRHGEPDYEADCLTETGKKQAQAVAASLSGMGISEIFASPLGRAQQTAAYTAERLHLTIQTLDYMREIHWGYPGGKIYSDDSHPWTLADKMAEQEDWRFTFDNWRQHPYFAQNQVLACIEEISVQIDRFLQTKGYKRVGNRYFCASDSPGRTIALFSHGGSSACALSHILNIPFPYLCAAMPLGLTSVTIVSFSDHVGQMTMPRLELLNDLHHLGMA